MMITGEKNINMFRLQALKGALSLEIKGMKHSRGSVYASVKREFGFKGNKEKVLEQLERYIYFNSLDDEGKRLIEEVGDYMSDGVRNEYTSCTSEDISKDDYGIINWLGENGYVNVYQDDVHGDILTFISLTSKGADVYEAMEGEA